jgi:hypothetical protein
MSAKPEKTHQMIFESEVLPSLFHATPEQFIQLLERDGNKFLHFYWNEAGKKIPQPERTSSFGLNHEIRRPARHKTVILVSLPQPQVEGEAYFVGLAYRPLRVTPFLFISDTTKVIALKRVLTAQEEPGTLLVEWDRKLHQELLGPGPEARLNDFYAAVLAFIKE